MTKEIKKTKETMVRDFTQITPRPKSEVRRRLLELEFDIRFKERHRIVGEVAEKLKKYKCGEHRKLFKLLSDLLL